jgi:hypothetical protein
VFICVCVCVCVCVCEFVRAMPRFVAHVCGEFLVFLVLFSLTRV